MDETHTIAAALPTAENDEQTQFHGRAPRPTAVTALEDLMPRELFIWAARSNGLLTDDEASRNPTLVAAWALAEANPSENLPMFAQAAAAEAEEAA